MCVCAYPRVEFPRRLTRRPYLLSKRRHCRVERTTKEPASRVLRSHTHIHTGLLCIYVTILIQWRHVDWHLYCYWSMGSSICHFCTTKNQMLVLRFRYSGIFKQHFTFVIDFDIQICVHSFVTFEVKVQGFFIPVQSVGNICHTIFSWKPTTTWNMLNN